MRKYSNEELNSLYDQAESIDKEVFSGMRSNLLLISGDHYNKRRRKEYVNRVRDAKGVADDQKLRLTKNHMAKISSLYVNNIVSNAPGVTLVPNNEKEIQDQKAADLNKKVWERAKYKHKLKAKIRNFAKDFCELGEVYCKIYWDPFAGVFEGYEPLMETMDVPERDPETDEVVFERIVQDDKGEDLPDKGKPVFSGDFVFERIFGFNVLRAPEAKSLDESAYLIERKMANNKDLRKKYEGDEAKLKLIEKSQDDTFLVYDSHQSQYSKSNTETLLLEYYFRPCMRYPNGYFFIKTKAGILEEGELPYGIFPIKYTTFEETQTSPRGKSRFKDLRAYQIEINRASSAMATHQITLGDDKIIANTMGKIENSAALPGVRFIKVGGGGDLKYLPGRAGDQYLPYINSQIDELYAVAMLSEEMADKEPVGDVFANLFKSLKQKKKFALYVEKFEEFLCEVAGTYLDLARHYLSDEEIIAAIGREEIINVEEFRNTKPLSYQVKVEAQTSDVESQYGKQLALNHALQYSSNLGAEETGKILKNMPLLNMGDTFDSFLMDEQNGDNMILMLERGKEPLINEYDDESYMIQRLTHRMRKPDFQFLDQMIQDNFKLVLQIYEQIASKKVAETQRAQAGFIPTDGYMISVDFSITTDDGKTKRAKIPYTAMDWLIQKLQEQGSTQDMLGNMPERAALDVMNQAGGQMPPPQQPI